MKIVEIITSDSELTFDTLIHNVAVAIFDLFTMVSRDTDNMNTSPQDIYTFDEISDFKYMSNAMHQTAIAYFSNNSQSVKLTSALLAYFNTGF